MSCFSVIWGFLTTWAMIYCAILSYQYLELNWGNFGVSLLLITSMVVYSTLAILIFLKNNE